MNDPRLPARLGRILLGLLAHGPMSGYDLRKVLVDTPMATFSDSPGAVYPALRRLQEEGLVRPQAGAAPSGRGRRALEVTAKGRARLRAWLFGPVARADIMGRPNELMLRFSFMSALAGEGEILAFLDAFRQGLKAYSAELEAFHAAAAPAMLPTGRLASEAGIEGYRTLLQWADRARARLKRGGRG